MVVEMVLMKLRTGVSEPAFLWAAEGTTAFLQACPGFIRRRLAKDAYGQWVDYLEWETMDAARQAAERFHSDPAMVVFNAVIGPGSVIGRHMTLQASAERAAAGGPASKALLARCA